MPAFKFDKIQLFVGSRLFFTFKISAESDVCPFSDI